MAARMAGTTNFTSFLDLDNDHATESNMSQPSRSGLPASSKGNKFTNKQTFVKSNQSNSEDKKGTNRSSKRMFFFRKQSCSNSLTTVLKDSNAGNTQSNTSNSITSESNKKKSRWTTPTIIRPVANSRNENVIRKKVPPRPPPPKLNKANNCISVIPLDPPSYEEVLRADVNNRGGMIHKPRSLKGPAPPAPVRANNNNFTEWPRENLFTTIDISYPLIDLSSPQPTQVPTGCPKAISGDLLELDEIFSKLGGPSDEKDNAWSFSSVQEDDNYKRLDDNIFQTSSNSMFSSQKPIPKPRTSLTGVNHLTESDEGEGPALPPRPNLRLQSDSLEFTSYVENEIISSSPPPPLPPRPRNYFDSEQETDDFSPVFLSWQRPEPHGIALYDYAATQGDDLSFKVNDTITLIHRINDEWFYGCLGEREGMFPRSFIQIIIPLPDDPEFQEEGSVAITGPRCLALFDFVSDREDELSFRVGDMIRLMARISDHWLKGVLKDKIGLVPSNFVRVIQDLQEDSSALTEASVQYDFHAESPMELSCKAGDVIRILYPIDSDWIFAQNDGKEGMVPWRYLDFGN